MTNSKLTTKRQVYLLKKEIKTFCINYYIILSGILIGSKRVIK